MEIRDEITIWNKNDEWAVIGFRASEDKVFDDRGQAAAYANRLAEKHFRAVVWLPVTLEELTSGRK